MSFTPAPASATFCSVDVRGAASGRLAAASLEDCVPLTPEDCELPLTGGGSPAAEGEGMVKDAAVGLRGALPPAAEEEEEVLGELLESAMTGTSLV